MMQILFYFLLNSPVRCPVLFFTFKVFGERYTSEYIILHIYESSKKGRKTLDTHNYSNLWISIIFSKYKMNWKASLTRIRLAQSISQNDNYYFIIDHLMTRFFTPMDGLKMTILSSIFKWNSFLIE